MVVRPAEALYAESTIAWEQTRDETAPSMREPQDFADCHAGLWLRSVAQHSVYQVQ